MENNLYVLWLKSRAAAELTNAVIISSVKQANDRVVVLDDERRIAVGVA